MNRRLSGDTSLNARLREEGEQEGQNRLSALRDALSVLNPRERRIFEARRLSDDPITLEDLSGEFGVSRERVRQIEVRAFERVRSSVLSGSALRETPRG